ncbi:uncharacterized protein J8A68_005832 [[Candida] subhashii]|uniref:Rhomboid-type serine protease n=1 Tax=[Candida] subhashii TaxID=561895 RepID=A0A8J5QLH2_9ASCO|nr:uncharacterized protein J8A68_005832 [[Candida] subhashii]KAG7660715.1 hypothetical protein J8A68_005832 [[Candida] subhashii]
MYQTNNSIPYHSGSKKNNSQESFDFSPVPSRTHLQSVLDSNSNLNNKSDSTLFHYYSNNTPKSSNTNNNSRFARDSRRTSTHAYNASQHSFNTTQPLDEPQGPFENTAMLSHSHTPRQFQQQQQYPDDEYEMVNLNNRDLPPLPPQPPQSNSTSSSNTLNPRTYDNTNLQSPTPSDPFSNKHFFQSESDKLEEGEFFSENERDRFRRNESNRLQTLRSKPRFHWTKLPYFTIVITTIQVVVFIVELVRMAQLTGSAFQTAPYFNPMLGPSTYLFINMGARYVPCMHQVKDVTDDTSILFPCPNSTTVDTYVCSLNELCGLSGLPIVDNKYIPDQWYRIFIPIFLHAGFLHIIFNLLLQVTMGASMERHIGILKYAVIYIASGIAGFLLGANFTPVGIASTGASGALFGVVATNIMLFIFTGKKNTNMYGTKHYTLFICIMIGEIVISLVLGLLPGLDNFSHIGGFAMGILLAILLLKDPYWVYIDGIISYRLNPSLWQQFLNNWNPLFAKEDKKNTQFIIWCAARAIALILAIVYFVALAKNFFDSDLDQSNNCSWCKYINCIPVHDWCDIGQVTVSQQSGTATATTSPTAVLSDMEPVTATTDPTLTTTTGVGQVITTTIVTPLPTSIENPNAVDSGDDGNNNQKRDINIIKQSHVFEQQKLIHNKQIQANGFVEEQNLGGGIYIIIAMFTFMFLKKKRLI